MASYGEQSKGARFRSGVEEVTSVFGEHPKPQSSRSKASSPTDLMAAWPTPDLLPHGLPPLPLHMPTLACPSATTAAIVAAAPPRNYRPDFPRVRIQKLDAPDATRLAYYNELQGKVLPGLVKAGMRPRHSYSRRRSRVWRILVLSSSRRRRISRIRFQAIFFLALSASSMSRTWQRWITARQVS